MHRLRFLAIGSLLLLTIVYNLLELGDKLGILLFSPSVVGTLNTFLHLLESLLQHRREVGVHRLNILVEVLDLIIFLVLNLLLVLLYLQFLLLKRLDFLFVFVNALLELGLVFAKLLIRRLVLTGHVGHDGVSAPLLSFLGLLQL